MPIRHILAVLCSLFLLVTLTGCNTFAPTDSPMTQWQSSPVVFMQTTEPAASQKQFRLIKPGWLRNTTVNKDKTRKTYTEKI